MIRKLSQPPMIIFMEVLTLFLFVFMLQTSPSILFTVPKNSLFVGGQLIYTDHQTGEIKYLSNNHWIKADRNFGGALFATSPCTDTYCTDIPSENGENISIAITGDLFERISKLNFMACNANPSECGNINYTITNSGEVDKEALQRDNAIFRQMAGLDNYLR